MLANGPAAAADVIDWQPGVRFAEELDELFREAFGQKARISATPIDTRLAELGRELFDVLLPTPIRDCLAASIRIAQAEDCKLRVRFDLPAALSDLPVEILYPPRGDPIGSALALNGSLSVVRSVVSRENPRLPRPEDDEQPLSVLVVVASPRGQPPLPKVADELRRLRETLSYFTGFNGLVLDVLGGEPDNDPPTLGELTAKVEEPGNPLAVLLIAHGETSPDRGQACVVLESDDGSAQPIDADHLAVTFGNAPRVRFVVLNLCVGAKVVGREPLSGVAQAIISNGVPAVVGMSTDVSDEAVSRFSAPLLHALSSNRTIDDAVQSARIHMNNTKANTRIEWCAPVLCVGGGFLRGQLFKVRLLDQGNTRDSGRIDPIREGLEAKKRLESQGYSAFDDLAPAAFFARATGRWKEVRARSASGRNAKDEQHRARFKRLHREACTELAIDEIDELCLSLASDFPGAQLALPALWDVPKPIVDRLMLEVARANERRQLHERYDKGLEAERKEDWATAVEQFEIFGERDYLDGRQRLAYATGRFAEDEGRWGDARDAYAEVGDRLPDSDVELRRPYVQGRAAELEDEWPKATEAYAELSEDYRDRDQRLPYARGRSAEQAGDWPGVVAAFGSVEHTYRDVALRRGYADGRIAEGENAWPTVIEVLTGLDDDFHDGDLGRLRTLADARQAEDDDRWDRAAEIYQTLDDGERDVAARRPYAEGRRAEAREDWAPAVEAYQRLADDYRDVASRRWYVTARAAEEGDWASAIHAYEAIPEHPHTAERLPYAKACRAVDVGGWKAVIEALDGCQVAEDLRETAKLLCGYARSRVAEDAGQWLEAARAYRGCEAFRDAPARAVYVEGRDLEDRADWSEALAAYESVAHLADAHQAARRLTKLRDALPWVDGLPRRGLVEDPCPLACRASPYQTLRAAGIAPSSTNQEVKDASYVLMAGDLWTADVRIAWDRLRSVPERLEADALLYRLVDAPALSRAQRGLDPGPSEELVGHLQGQLDVDGPLVLLLCGRREAAIAEWGARLRRNLSDAGVAHALSLAWTWHAVELGEQAQHERSAQAWERSIAYWGRVLSDDAYWASWRSRRASCYQFAVSAADVSRARRAVVDGLSKRLAEVADRSRLDGQAKAAERYRRLRLALAVEVAAARALAGTGGMSGGEPTTPACGPLFVRLHPDLREPLGHLVARLDAEERADGAAPGAGFCLRCAFSELGEAIVLLEQNRPDRALETMRGLHRVMLVDLPADCGHELGADGTDCAECAEFAERNPGHTGLRHRRTRLLQDAVDLATRAFLALAQAALVDGRPGMDTALRHWREAIEVAANIGASVRVKQAMVPVALGRADVLKDEHWGKRLADERLTEAIDLIAAARQLVGNVDAGQLTAKEAELLTIRGIWRGCWCYEYEEPSYQRGVDDLRRALTLNSESLDTRDNLAHGLIFWAQSLNHQSSAGLQLRLLGEALTTVHEGWLRAPGYVPFGAVLAEVLDELEQWCFDELTDEELDRRLRERSTVPEAEVSTKAEQLIRKADEEFEKYPVVGVLNLIAAVRAVPSAEIRMRLVDAVTLVSGRAEWSEGC